MTSSSRASPSGYKGVAKRQTAGSLRGLTTPLKRKASLGIYGTAVEAAVAFAKHGGEWRLCGRVKRDVTV